MAEMGIVRTKGDVMIQRAESQFWAYEKEYLNPEKSKNLILLDNVQFIYELSLAELELKALGVCYESLNGLREFKVLNKENETKEIIRKKTSYFKSLDGKYSDYFQIIQKNQTRSVNQYLTHWIYPYKGKFHPQMIRALLNVIGLKQGDTVFEPFSGSGTTALEAQLLGINFIGIDISPLCVIQGRVKTESIYVLDRIEELKNKIVLSKNSDLFDNQKKYYKMIDDLTSNERVRIFYRMARLLAVSDNSRRGRNFKESYIRNIDLMISSIKDYIEVKKKLDLNLGNVKISVGDSREIKMKDESIDGIITSPPYSIALDYVQNDVHSLSDLGYDVQAMRDDFVGVRGIGKSRVELYNEDMKRSYSEMYRILKPGKFAVIVIGNAMYQGQEVKTV
ncbi:MAG: DNA methyltransferase, partial [Elusimicrobiota bacterium]